MMNILFDTSFLVEIDRKNPKAINLAKTLTLEGYSFWISTITISEIMVGINLAKNFELAKENGTYVLNQFRWIDFDSTAATKTGQIIAHLRASGKTIEFQDAAIAASGLVLGVEYLVTQNKKHFSDVSFLKEKIFTIDELLLKIKKSPKS